MTAAEIASSSSVPPPWSGATEFRFAARTMPPTPAIRPEIAKTMMRMRGDVDAGAPRRLGVPADGVDVAPEHGALRDVRPQDQEHGHLDARERQAVPVRVAGSRSR